jgi:hypothetical protein
MNCRSSFCRRSLSGMCGQFMDRSPNSSLPRWTVRPHYEGTPTAPRHAGEPKDGRSMAPEHIATKLSHPTRDARESSRPQPPNEKDQRPAQRVRCIAMLGSAPPADDDRQVTKRP